jgi:tetratricopeptide (TPR) repeat protein
MSKNKINQAGSGNVAISDIHNSEISIVIGKSYQYNELVDQLTTQEKLFARTPETETQERLEISQKINQLKQSIEQLKRDVLQLAEQFNRVDINTERLRRAKEYFDEGQFGEARAVLECEIEQLQDEQTRLLVKRDAYETDTLPKLRSNAEQFFILGLLTQLDYANPNWFIDACHYFESAIKSYPTKGNVFQYAIFCWRHNLIAEAENLYEKYLKDFTSEISVEEKAGALNNLGLLHWDSNEYRKGLSECEEALSLYEDLSKDNPLAYLFEVAGTLNNIALFHNELNENSKALEEYMRALGIYRELAKKSTDYLLNVAKVLNNLGIINTHTKNHDEALNQLKESLSIYRSFTKARSQEDSFMTATVLHNLGVLYCETREYESALEAYKEAASIRLIAARINPSVYLPEASCTLANLAFYFYEYVPNREESLEYALETIEILLPIVDEVPFTQQYFQTAVSVSKRWGLSAKDLDRMIRERITNQ